jgi:hypothetical protein
MQARVTWVPTISVSASDRSAVPRGRGSFALLGADAA